MGGFQVDTNDNWKCVIDGTVVQVVTGNKNEWVGGHTLTMVSGTKTFHIKGHLEELFAGVKIEIIFPWEIKWLVGNTTDIHVGGTIETVLALSFEIDKSRTYHFGIPGQKTFITANKLESLEHELLVGTYKQRIGQEYMDLAETLESVGSMAQKIGSMEEHADTLGGNIVNWWLRTSYMVIRCSSFSLKISGPTKYDVGKLDIKAKGTCHVKGGSIKLEGGGATLAVGGGVKANTVDLTA